MIFAKVHFRHRTLHHCYRRHRHHPTNTRELVAAAVVPAPVPVATAAVAAAAAVVAAVDTVQATDGRNTAPVLVLEARLPPPVTAAAVATGASAVRPASPVRLRPDVDTETEVVCRFFGSRRFRTFGNLFT